jgi:hypothetical protein
MKNWMFAACALLLFAVAGCTKYTTPRKVSKRIVDGSWTITSFTIDGESVASQYAGYTFGFGESGSVIVKASAIGLSESGSWELGLNKNPAILYLSFAPVGGLEYLATIARVQVEV